MDLVCIGTPAVDYLHTKRDVIVRYGGSQTTTACTVAKLGLKAGLLGYIGIDEAGQGLIKDIQKHGVDTSMLRKMDKTRIIHIQSNPNERVFMRIENQKDIDMLNSEEIDYIKKSRAVFIKESYNALQNTVAVCEENDIDMFVTMQNSINKNIEVIKESKNVRIIFANEKELPEPSIFQNKMVVITRGENGCSIIENRKTHNFGPYQVTPIDSTGSGDVFAGAFIYGYLNNCPLEKCAKLANAAGALATTKHGGRSILDSLSIGQLEQFAGI